MARIDSEAALRGLYKPVSERAAIKDLKRLDRYCRQFIELSPFLLLATHNQANEVDISPRGDGPGFVDMPDDGTLLIPDRPGNNRLESLANIISNPTVSVIFLVPGIDETLRVRGHAEIRDDADLKGRFEIAGRLPTTVIKISIDTVFYHCAKALMRSRLWDPEAQVERSVMPSLGKILKEQLNLKVEAETQDEMVERYKETLY